ncbi:MAG: zinc-ribbon domain-containing protein [Candidatus Thorarchaeota archaeon]
MPSCDACGAEIDVGDKECPYCGHELMKRIDDRLISSDREEVYEVDRESGKVHFGDGITGARPPTGDSLSSSYRVGGGQKGTIPCANCRHVNPPMLLNCEACGAELQRKILYKRRER